MTFDLRFFTILNSSISKVPPPFSKGRLLDNTCFRDSILHVLCIFYGNPRVWSRNKRKFLRKVIGTWRSHFHNVKYLVRSFITKGQVYVCLHSPFGWHLFACLCVMCRWIYTEVYPYKIHVYMFVCMFCVRQFSLKVAFYLHIWILCKCHKRIVPSFLQNYPLWIFTDTTHKSTVSESWPSLPWRWTSSPIKLVGHIESRRSCAKFPLFSSETLL